MPDQKLGDRSLPAVSIQSGVNTFVVLFDPATKLPAAIRTLCPNGIDVERSGDPQRAALPLRRLGEAGGRKQAGAQKQRNK